VVLASAVMYGETSQEDNTAKVEALHLHTYSTAMLLAVDLFPPVVFAFFGAFHASSAWNVHHADN